MDWVDTTTLVILRGRAMSDDPTTLSHADRSPVAPQLHREPTADRTSRPRAAATRTWGTATAVGLLSALLASGATYAVVEAADGGTAPVVAEASTDRGAATPATSNAAYQPAQDWTAVAARVTPSVVSISVETARGQGAGSGVVWDAQGHVVTNAHVASGAATVQVTLHDGRTYTAKVVGTDASTDLAVLLLDNAPDDLAPIAVGDDAGLSVGDPVMAVGNPLGLSGTVTTGIVSALDRPVTTASESADPATGQAAAVVTNAIQTSAAINPGNSGGALVDAGGALVGINSSIASLSSGGGGQSGSIGIGFAIPVTEVSSVAGQLIADGTVEHAFLGVALDDTKASRDGASVQAAAVTQVESGSPAEGAGLRSGDAITDIDGERVSGALSLVAQVRERTTGDEVTLGVLRAGERLEVTVTLDARPDNA